MTRSTPRLFLRDLRELGVDLAPKEPGAEIHPRKLFRALSRRGFEILDFPRPIRPDSDDCDVLFARYDSARFDF